MAFFGSPRKIPVLKNSVDPWLEGLVCSGIFMMLGALIMELYSTIYIPACITC